MLQHRLGPETHVPVSTAVYRFAGISFSHATWSTQRPHLRGSGSRNLWKRRSTAFDGDLDFGGRYVVLQAIPDTPGRIASEIQRTDDQALNGFRYAVLISDHTPTNLEMKHAIISFWRHKSFALADRSVSIKWAGPDVLTLTTTAAGTRPEWVLRQRRQIGDIAILYSGQP